MVVLEEMVPTLFSSSGEGGEDEEGGCARGRSGWKRTFFFSIAIFADCLVVKICRDRGLVPAAMVRDGARWFAMLRRGSKDGEEKLPEMVLSNCTNLEKNKQWSVVWCVHEAPRCYSVLRINNCSRSGSGA